MPKAKVIVWMVAGAADSSSADPSEVPALLVAATAVRHPTNRIPLVATVALQVGAAVEEVVLLKPPTGARGAAVVDFPIAIVMVIDASPTPDPEAIDGLVA